jgi:hypothetical protein
MDRNPVVVLALDRVLCVVGVFHDSRDAVKSPKRDVLHCVELLFVAIHGFTRLVVKTLVVEGLAHFQR